MRAFAFLAFLLMATSCTSGEFKNVGCLDTKKGIVIVKSRTGGALDGTDYEVCTSFDSLNCDKYNYVSSLRPLGLKIDVVDAAVKVTQSGGSVDSFVSDAKGLISSDYEKSMPIELLYVPNGREDNLSFFMGGKPIHPRKCR